MGSIRDPGEERIKKAWPGGSNAGFFFAQMELMLTLIPLWCTRCYKKYIPAVFNVFIKKSEGGKENEKQAKTPFFRSKRAFLVACKISHIKGFELLLTFIR